MEKIKQQLFHLKKLEGNFFSSANISLPHQGFALFSRSYRTPLHGCASVTAGGCPRLARPATVPKSFLPPPLFTPPSDTPAYGFSPTVTLAATIAAGSGEGERPGRGPPPRPPTLLPGSATPRPPPPPLLPSSSESPAAPGGLT